MAGFLAAGGLARTVGRAPDGRAVGGLAEARDGVGRAREVDGLDAGGLLGITARVSPLPVALAVGGRLVGDDRTPPPSRDVVGLLVSTGLPSLPAPVLERVSPLVGRPGVP